MYTTPNRHSRTAKSAWAVICILLSGCGSTDPFDYETVTGTITYEDGTLIPADGLTLTFLSQRDPVDSKTHPRPGQAVVDEATGAFSNVTTYKLNDGVVRGRHKVTVTGAGGMTLPESIVPLEYADADKTPLFVDTDNLPFEIKVRKPL